MTYLLGWKQHYRYILFIFFIAQNIVAQEKNFSTPDSLEGKSYDYLFNSARKNYNDTITSLVYLKTSLEKAIQEGNKANQSHALIQLAYYAEDSNQKLTLIKESVAISNETHNVHSILPRFTLGLYYYHHFEYEKALQEYLKVLNVSKEINDTYYEHLALNHIAELKAAIGKHEEAVILYKKSLLYETTKDPIDSIQLTDILMHLAESMRYLKKHDSASYYYKYIEEKGHDLHYYKNIATINQGISLYETGAFEEGKQLLDRGSHEVDLNYSNNKKYYILSQFYLGKIHQQTQKSSQKAKEYFLIVDSLISTTKIIIPETREVYEFFIADAKKQRNVHKELVAINKLLQFDSIATSRKIGIINKLHSEYDAPQLLKSKEAIINSLKNKTTAISIWAVYLILFILLLIVLFIIKHYKHKEDKNRFNTIISALDTQKTEHIPSQNVSTTQKTLLETIDETTISSIIDKLKQFEEKKGFLQKNITLTILAKKCETNTKYLPKIISIYKDKTFVNYINSLRIDYILKELKENTTIQKYTIKTISEEAGFNNPESFVKAFKNKTNIRPSYYIRNLKRKDEN